MLMRKKKKFKLENDEKIEISLPLNFIGYNRDGENPVLFFYKIFKNFVSMGRI